MTRKEALKEVAWQLVKPLVGLMIFVCGCIEYFLKCGMFLAVLFACCGLGLVDAVIFRLIFCRQTTPLDRLLFDLDQELVKLSQEVFSMMK